VLGKAYRFYFLRVLPRLGEWISGVEGAYSYLPASVRSFPPPEELRDRITRAGFGTARFHLLTGGIAVLLTAVAER
jgi:demethylmenaquinone methyltransferase/2-methoxy-6-polyprenyl-1,4-benzoquinol methylase